MTTAPQRRVCAGYTQYSGAETHGFPPGFRSVSPNPSNVRNTAIGSVKATSFLIVGAKGSESICVSVDWLRFFLDESPRQRQERTDRSGTGLAPGRAGAGPATGRPAAG